jgi:hypothetical protein
MGETLAVVYWDDPGTGPSDFTEVMTLEEAVAKSKELAAAGLNCTIFKLTETHYFKAEK